MPRPRKSWSPRLGAQQRTVRRVVGYLRVSTDEQATEGYGLDAQEGAIRGYAAAAGYELIGIHRDAGISGTYGPDKRPGLAAVLADVASGAVDGVVVKALDRIGRRPAVATAVFDALDTAGVQFLSINEPFLSSDLLRGLFAGIASDERKRILERTAGGRVSKAATGGYAGGRVPYGYRLVGSRREARWEVDGDAAGVVRCIFGLRVAGARYQSIADHLNRQGIRSPASDRWSARGIYGIVSNPAYTGIRRWREGREIVAHGEHTPLIDQATYDRCNHAV